MSNGELGVSYFNRRGASWEVSIVQAREDVTSTRWWRRSAGPANYLLLTKINYNDWVLLIRISPHIATLHTSSTTLDRVTAP
jgi:hypothetical protein